MPPGVVVERSHFHYADEKGEGNYKHLNWGTYDVGLQVQGAAPFTARWVPFSGNSYIGGESRGMLRGGATLTFPFDWLPSNELVFTLPGDAKCGTHS